MAELQYNSAIKIVSKNGYGLDTAAEMPAEEGAAFVARMKELLDELSKLDTGKKMLADIEQANKEIQVFCADPGNGSAAKPHPPTVSNEMNRFVLLRQIPEKAVDKLRKEGFKGTVPEAKFYGAEFTSILQRSRVKLQIIQVLLGLSGTDIISIMFGEKALTQTQYVRFAMYMFPHLSRGEGCSVSFRFEEAQADQDDNDTPLIILAHELIHAWRMVKGERVFEGGWEEEAMTVGLPPFTNTEINENKFRLEMGLSMRTSYTARCTTTHYQVVHTIGGESMGKGLWPEQLAAWDRWKAKNADLVADYEKAVRKGKSPFASKKKKQADIERIAHMIYGSYA